MKKVNNMVSVLDTIIDGQDEKYEGVMKCHRGHYGQFYNIYKQLGRNQEDEIEYVNVDEEQATFKIQGVECDEVEDACNRAAIYESHRTTSIKVEKTGDTVAVNISIK